MSNQICKTCGEVLVFGVNCAPSRELKRHFVCNRCMADRIALRKLTDPDFCNKTKEYLKEYNLPPERKEINKKQKKNWEKANPTKVKNNGRRMGLLSRYGITLEDYATMLENQNFSCAICGTNVDSIPSKILHVDHCHTSGKVRGLLCGSCNRGIGLLKENTIVLTKAIEYLANGGISESTGN